MTNLRIYAGSDHPHEAEGRQETIDVDGEREPPQEPHQPRSPCVHSKCKLRLAAYPAKLQEYSEKSAKFARETNALALHATNNPESAAGGHYHREFWRHARSAARAADLRSYIDEG